MTDYLENIARAKRHLADLEQDLRIEFEKTLAAKLSEANDELSIAVGTAHRAGISKAAIGRALKTKDYSTYNKIIQHGDAILGAVAAHEPHLDAENIITAVDNTDVIRYDKETDSVFVTHSGDSATFDVVDIDGQMVFTSETPLWNDDYSKRNEVVALLDGALDGDLYRRVVETINGG